MSGLVLLNLNQCKYAVLVVVVVLCLMFCVVSLFNLSKLRPCASPFLALTLQENKTKDSDLVMKDCDVCFCYKSCVVSY